MKEHPFFNGIDWNVVYQQKYPPPLIPPRGEVNAADAFDIGSFDEEDTKGMCTQCTTMCAQICHTICMSCSTNRVVAYILRCLET